MNAMAAACTLRSLPSQRNTRTLPAKSPKQVLLTRTMFTLLQALLQELDVTCQLRVLDIRFQKFAEQNGISGKEKGAAIAILRELNKNESWQEKTQWVWL